jgi:hypothetical protein
MRGWRFRVFSSFEPREPRVRLGACDMLAGRLVVGPGDKGVSLELLTSLLTREVLVDCFAHEPVRRAATHIGKSLQT